MPGALLLPLVLRLVPPLIAMRFALSRAFGEFGRVTVSTPFLSWPWPVFLDIERQRDPPLETSVEALAKPSALVLRLGLLLAAQGKDPIINENFDVFLVEPGELGREAQFVIGRVHFDGRPRPAPAGIGLLSNLLGHAATSRQNKRTRTPAASSCRMHQWRLRSSALGPFRVHRSTSDLEDKQGAACRIRNSGRKARCSIAKWASASGRRA